MMSHIKNTLRKYPRAYNVLQRTYYKALYITEVHLLGSKVHELIWKSSIHKVTSETYSHSAKHPHREFLVNKIAQYQPFDTALEVGCNAAPNLSMLARKFPGSTFYGVDINQEAIALGKDIVAKSGIQNVHLSSGRADDLSRYADKSMDIIFTDATLIYVGPDKIDVVFNEMKRVAKKALIFNEWNLNQGLKKSGRSFWNHLHWVHDYKSILSKYFPSENIEVTKLPKDMWGSGGWEDYGSLVEVKI